ncbi:MAG TPA: hypothetical protein VK927_07015, partial [Adhaeribacter sp.]|nr:hypothetical protein [Adhaeribacter sp.]
EPGLYLICLNLQGEPQWYEKVLSVCSECIEFTGFVLHPRGGFVLTAATGSGGLYSVPEIDFGQTGGFMLARISERGKLIWANVAKLATSAYSTGPIVQLGIHTSGTVYVTGIYQKAIAFSEDEKTPGYPLSGGNERNDLPLKSFLAAYSAEGTLKWVRYSGENYATSAIYATKKLIYLGASTNGPKPFGLKADTTNQKKCALLAFKHSGKPAWIKTFPLKKIDAITASPNEKNLYLAGQIGDNKLIRLGNDTLKGRIFVAGFSPKGKYKWSGSAKFWTNKQINLIVDKNHNLYAAGYFDTGRWRTLSTWDPAFIAGYTQGGTPFLGLIKIPSKHR